LEINWKLIGIFGGIGFFFSFIAGAIGGVKFGTILLRGIVSGALFGVLGFGLTFVIKKFLPGLESEEGASEQEEQQGVDIVIEEEAPAAGSESLPEIINEGGEIPEGEDFVEEVEETSGENMKPVEEVESLSGEEEPEELVEIDDAENGGVDSLPDISEFSGSFSSGSDEGMDDSDGPHDLQSSSGGESTIDVLGSEESPANIAKAVQTMLKRD